MSKIIALTSTILLSACATLEGGQTQEMTILTPGAERAKCFIKNEDMKYVAYSGQTLEIMKSPNDLVVNCLADGNREQTVHVKRDVNEWVVVNVANGFVPGATYDYFSRGAFAYPETITVSFASKQTDMYPLPRHAGQTTYSEYRGPTEVVTPEMRNQAPHVLQKRQDIYGASSQFGNETLTVPSAPRQIYDPTEEDK